MNYFMINLHESMGPGRDQTRDPGSAVRHVSAVRQINALCGPTHLTRIYTIFAKTITIFKEILFLLNFVNYDL